jgi:hypothetical protein
LTSGQAEVKELTHPGASTVFGQSIKAMWALKSLLYPYGGSFELYTVGPPSRSIVDPEYSLLRSLKSLRMLPVVVNIVPPPHASPGVGPLEGRSVQWYAVMLEWR